MEGTFIDLLLNGSPMAAFAGFLIYLYRTQQARMDSLVDKFQDQLEGIRKEYKEDVVELRSRYDAVIDGQSQEKARIKTNIDSKLNEVQMVLTNINATCQGLAISQELTKEELDAIAQNVQLGLTALKDMQDQEKLKEIARQAIKSRS
jgi:hypothetical protein